MKRTFRSFDDIRAMMAVARGEAPPDMLITGGQTLNVYSGEVLPATVAVAAGRIAYVGDRPINPGPQTTVVDARGRVLAPGYVDPHSHPQALFTPDELARTVLPLGTTALIADTLMLLYLTAPETTHEVMDALSGLPLRFFWFLRLHGQAHSPNDATVLSEERVAALLARDDVRTVGEITRWPLVYDGDEMLLRRIVTGLEAGRRVEGHAPGASSDRIQVLTAAGFSSEHEAITAEQALARLRAGLYIMLRHGSLRGDLPALAGVASGARAFSGRIMMTPDGPQPPFIAAKGYMDYLVSTAIGLGIDPLAAYQMVTVNPATYYGLDEELGGLAPGRRADINVLEQLDHPRPQMVITGGRVVAREGRLTVAVPPLPWSTWLRPLATRSWRPDASLFAVDGLPSPAPVMHLESSAIASRRDIEVADGLRPGVLHLVLFDPAGRWRSRTLLSGFANDLGGLASSFAAAAGIYTLGRSPADMAAAAARVLDLGGGIVLVDDGAIRFELPLPLGGIMSGRPLREIAAAIESLTALLRTRGYRHGDLPSSLLFFGFDSLPYIRLTYRGLWDVLQNQPVLPREDLAQ